MARERSERSKVSAPTCSKTTSTPDAELVGQTAELQREVGLAIEDRLIRAERTGTLRFFGAADGREDPAGVPQFRDLDGGAPDAGAARLDEDRFAGTEPGPGHEHVPRRHHVQRQGGRLGERERGGLGDQIAERHEHLLRAAAVHRLAIDSGLRAERVVAGETGDAVPAREAGSDNDFVTGFPRAAEGAGQLIDRLADRFNDARHLRSGDDRQRELVPRHAASDPEVEVVEGYGANGDDRHAGGRGRGGNVGPFELVDATMLADEDRFHRSWQFIARRSG